jgi:hypothetical protein
MSSLEDLKKQGAQLMKSAKYDEAIAVFTQCSLSGILSTADESYVLTNLGYACGTYIHAFIHSPIYSFTNASTNLFTSSFIQT